MNLKKICIGLFMLILNTSMGFAATVDNDTHTAYTGTYKFYNSMKEDLVLTNKPAMLFTGLKGTTYFYVQLAIDGYKNAEAQIIFNAGKNVEIQYSYQIAGTGPTFGEVYDAWKNPYDQDAQERAKSAPTNRSTIFSLDTSSGTPFNTNNPDISAKSSTPGIIGIFSNGYLNFYLGDNYDNPPIASIACKGIYNCVGAMAWNRWQTQELDWEGTITLINCLDNV